MPYNSNLYGHWISIYTGKRKLRPILGSYKTSQFQQPPTRRDADLLDYRPRDVFTSRVCSSSLPLVGVPDIDWLRRKGHCLPTETEVLQSQRDLLMDRYFVDRTVRAPRELVRPVSTSRTAQSNTQAQDRFHSVVSSTSYWTCKSSSVCMAPAKTKYSSFVCHNEKERMMATQRQMEQRIMRSKAYHYQARLSQTISHAEGKTRKFVSEALDDDHKAILAKLLQDSEGSLDGSSKSSLFREWKRSVMSVIDLQAEDDLKRVANYRNIVRRSKPVLKKSKTIGVRSQSDITSKANTKSDSMFLYDVESVSTISDFPQQKQVQFLGQEETEFDIRPSAVSSVYSSATDISFDFDPLQVKSK